MNLFQDVLKSLQKSYSKLWEINFSENIGEILKSPLTILTLVGIIILFIFLLRTKRIKLTPKLMTQIAIMVAITVVLDFFKIYRMPQGGSITFGSMVPIILMSLWFGPEVGMLTGLLFGAASLLIGPFIVHPIQVLFDYFLAYLLLGTAGYLKNTKYVATIIAVTLRLACHIISGIVFFAEYAPEGQSVFMYSLVYNGSYLLPDLVICIIILKALPLDRLYKAVMRTSN